MSLSLTAVQAPVTDNFPTLHKASGFPRPGREGKRFTTTHSASQSQILHPIRLRQPVSLSSALEFRRSSSVIQLLYTLPTHINQLARLPRLELDSHTHKSSTTRTISSESTSTPTPTSIQLTSTCLHSTAPRSSRPARARPRRALCLLSPSRDAGLLPSSNTRS